MAGSGNESLRSADETLVRVENLYVEFPIGRTGAKVHAVSDVSFDVRPGETLGLVGESGCGKSTTGKAVMQINRPTGGTVSFDGSELTDMGGDELRRLRPQMQMIFQDPISSLNPRRKVGDIVGEPLKIWASDHNPPATVITALQRLLTAVGAIGVGGFGLLVLFWLVDGFFPYMANNDFAVARPAYEMLLSNAGTIVLCALIGGVALWLARTVRDRVAEARWGALGFGVATALLGVIGFSTLASVGRAIVVQTSTDDAAFEVPAEAAGRTSTDGTTTINSIITFSSSTVTVDLTVNGAPVKSTDFERSSAGDAALLALTWGAVALSAAVALLPLLPAAGADFARMKAIRVEHDAIVRRALSDVGLDPEAAMGRRPHQFSGGQCQRICIARSLVLDPKVIICDEPVSALDVSVQAQILNLLEEMKGRYDLTMLFIAHDLAVVKNISDRVAVMYLGKICEVAPPDDLYANPAHPYTAALLASIPVPDPSVVVRDEAVLGGEIPSPVAPPSGCRFRTRCPKAQDRCAQSEPKMTQVALGHYVACHFPLEATGPKPAAARLAEHATG